MSKKIDQEHAEEYLEQMIKDKPPKEPIEKTLSTFCQRFSLSMDECLRYYNRIVEGEAKEKQQG